MTDRLSERAKEWFAKLLLAAMLLLAVGCSSDPCRSRMYHLYIRDLEADLKLCNSAYEEMGKRVDQLMADSAAHSYRWRYDDSTNSVTFRVPREIVKKCRWFYADHAETYRCPEGTSRWWVDTLGYEHTVQDSMDCERIVRDSIWWCE